MRVYVPATLRTLRELRDAGEIAAAPLTAFAVTPALREWYAVGDLEELEYAAMAEAARASLRLLDADLDRYPGALPRRVVVAADVPDRDVELAPELDRAAVRVGVTVPLAQLASVHVDEAGAEPDVRAAARAVLAADLGSDDAQFVVDGAEGYELLWYATQELDDLLTDP
jgi:glycine/D-amino acid oxidase-like deaminating enzyme